MSDLILKKLKKYVLYISAIFFVSLWGHLVYSYLYHGAVSEAIEWWTISEAIIWNFPHFNPLVPSNDHNAYINGLLYRSMLEYSPETNSFIPNLVSCNLDNLLYIECVLENNLLWSDGSPITPSDIESTLNIIKETGVNPIIAALLDQTTIRTTEDSISFSNTTKDINFLHIFLQPILPSTVVNTLNTENIDGKFSEIGGIYSGLFVLKSISQDETVGITKITLGKNKLYFGNPLYIDFLILNLFRDETHFLKHKNSFNLFNDKNNVIGNTIPRLNSFEYTLSQFVWSFFNTETLDSDMRTYLSSVLKRDEIINTLGKWRVKAAYNPFLWEENIDSEVAWNFSITSYLEEKGYYSKKELLKSSLAIKANEKQISAEAQIPKQEEIIIPKEEKKTQETLSYITSPTTQKYNFVSEDNILLQWKVDAWVDAVFINDYQLSGFNAGDDIFYYRLLESYDSIQEWENNYKIYFEIWREKELKEEFSYIYYKDSDILAEVESTFFDSTWDSLEESASGSLSTWESTPSLPLSTIKTSLTAEEIQSLDPLYFYNTEGDLFQIKVAYAQSDALMEETARIVEEQLNKAGIAVELKWLSLWEITTQLRNEELPYDIMLIGINLGYFNSNTFPYFHSSQVKNGYNFANFKKLGLDILLEELKSNNLSSTKRQELEIKILDILHDENIIKVFYTPKLHLLADKNIKNFSFPEYIPDSKHRYFPLLSAYLLEKKIIAKEQKWFLGFFIYLIESFNL